MTEKKDLFKYFDGTSDVYGDPFEIDYRFEQSVMNRNLDMDLLAERMTNVPRKEDGTADTDRFDQGQQMLFLESCHSFIPLIADALELKVFDKKTGEGLQSLDVLTTWRAYVEWKAGVKKNTEMPPDSPTPTTESGPSISPMGPSVSTVRSSPRRSMVST